MCIMHKNLSILLTILLSTSFICKSPVIAETKVTQRKSRAVQEDLDPNHYLLPKNSPLRKTLDKIFSSPYMLKNSATFRAAGFETISFRRMSKNLRVAKHPLIPGYLFKLYLSDESVQSFQKEQTGLIRRAYIASEIRKIIQTENLTSITVADKWLYKLPQTGRKGVKNGYVLVVKDMQLVTLKKSQKTWRSKATQQHLKELHHILGAGYGSLSIARNIPYTKSKKFACIDTEYSKQKFALKNVKRHLSKKNKKIWKKICKDKQQQRRYYINNHH